MAELFFAAIPEPPPNLNREPVNESAFEIAFGAQFGFVSLIIQYLTRNLRHTLLT